MAMGATLVRRNGQLGKPRGDDRRMIGGIVHIRISGCRWTDAPPAYGPRNTLVTAFSAGRPAFQQTLVPDLDRRQVVTPRPSTATGLLLRI
jgi:transposase